MFYQFRKKYHTKPPKNHKSELSFLFDQLLILLFIFCCHQNSSSPKKATF